MKDDDEKENNSENQYATPSKKEKSKSLKSSKSPLTPLDLNAKTPSKSPISGKGIFSPKKYISVRDAFARDELFNQSIGEIIDEFSMIECFINEMKFYTSDLESLENLKNDLNESMESLKGLMNRECESFKQHRDDQETKDDIISTFKSSREIFRNRLQHFITKEKSSEDNQAFMDEILAVETRLQEIPEYNLEFLLKQGIHFSQREATDYFKDTATIKTSSPKIMGVKVEKVGLHLKEHPEAIEQLKIGFFIYKKHMVAENNRALSALSISKIPLNNPQLRLVGIAPSQLILNSYIEKLNAKVNPYQIDLFDDSGTKTMSIRTYGNKEQEKTPVKTKKSIGLKGG